MYKGTSSLGQKMAVGHICKCCVLSIDNIIFDTDICIAGKQLPIFEHNRDMGVIVSCDLSLFVHITNIVAKAHKRACITCGYLS